MKEAVIQHLEELRKRLIVVLVAFLALFIVGFFFSNILIEKVALLLEAENVRLIALTPLEFIYAQVKASLLLSLIFVSPLAFYEAVSFLKPALKKKEKTALRFFLPAFSMLFMAGLVFSYFFLKTALHFLAGLPASAGVGNFWSIQKFITFAFVTSLGFGLLFQIPLGVLGFNRLGIISKETLKGKRKYFYTSAFILAALITPPDAITQVMLAVPIIVLYELSLLLLLLFREDACLVS